MEGSTLKGLSQETFIYDHHVDSGYRPPHYAADADEDIRSYRGFYVQRGWPTVGISRKSDLVIAVIGVCVALWKYTSGDWILVSAAGAILLALVLDMPKYCGDRLTNIVSL